MNSCEYYQELISRLVDGEISADEHADLMAHMNTCSRCNAMYAVFHDLSEVLAEPVPLPEGLHENIMAGVRRSEIIKKNRRLRSFGLRTALTAAACAVLVLFAASGFAPGKRAESVSVRDPELVEALPGEAPVLVTSAPAATEAPVFEAPAAPAWTPVPTPVPTAAPTADAYLAAGSDSGSVYTQQPVWTPAPAVTPDYAAAQGQDFSLDPTPAPVQTPVWTPAPAVTPTVEETQAPALKAAQAPSPTPAEMAPDEDAPVLTANAAQETEQTEDAPEEPMGLFSLFQGAMDILGAANPEAEAADDGAAEEDQAPMAILMETEEPVLVAAAPTEAEDAGLSAENAAPELKTAAPVREQSVVIRGSEARSRLLALLGGVEAAFPEEAELTRTIRIALKPDDEFGGEEKLELRLYGDFVYYRLDAAEGGASRRADCALRDLEAFLRPYLEAQPSPTPTLDPYSE